MQEYQVTINGVSTTLQLSDEDAQRSGVSGRQPAGKARSAENKARGTQPATSNTGRRSSSSKRGRGTTAAQPQPDDGDGDGDDDDAGQD